MVQPGQCERKLLPHPTNYYRLEFIAKPQAVCRMPENTLWKGYYYAKLDLKENSSLFILNRDGITWERKFVLESNI